ncbi:MAG: hypothetical protein DRN01_06780 [Thermoplasmata archaeon]|nr:MAG: hypothetical protein DRN01_06780 [Thermoplasmata archaeon]
MIIESQLLSVIETSFWFIVFATVFFTTGFLIGFLLGWAKYFMKHWKVVRILEDEVYKEGKKQ